MSTNYDQRLLPSDLLEQASAIDRSRDSVWWIIHSLPRQEKALAHALEANNVAFYLPTSKHRSKSKGRTRIAEIVLFPGHVFAYGNENARLVALRTNRALTVRRAPNHDVLTTQLLWFKKLIDANVPLVPEVRVTPGERVRVKSGPFRGVEGIAIRRNGKDRLLLAIDDLQQGASLEIGDWLLETTDDSQSRPADSPEPVYEVSPPAIVIAWSPDQVSEEEYARLITAIGDVVRLEGGTGIRRLQSLGFGVPAESGVNI